jgi:two-component system, chemotaxis family, CheB/CheR fusion protein
MFRIRLPLVKETTTENASHVDFPVIGLGASAGGFEALTAFFEALPLNSGMAFVVVQHLAPQQESILAELIQRHTRINVQSISDEMPIESNQVYVLPAGYELSIEKNHLRLNDRTKNDGWPETINRFLESLALDRAEKAAALILSGAGHDGTEGAKAVKNQGGLVIAQDLETALQDSMPFSVIDAGLANAVLSPDLMPSYLLKYFKIVLPDVPKLVDLSESISDDDLKRIVRQLRVQTNFDFKDYKASTLRRQIARRISAHRLLTAKAYLALIKQQSSEADQLVKGLLVHVTRFFRDPDAFDSLKLNALLPLLKKLSIDNVFRVWVPGCASGEEAVSLAILIYECLRELDMLEMEVRIFATDMNRDLIQRARSGIYPVRIAEEISAERLKDHFIPAEDGYQVRIHISRMIVWSEHNLIEHPPFSSLYLISCRNVLIYFQSQLQEKIRALFQFALRPEGILFLGSSEAMPVMWDLFTVIDSKHRIYRRMAGSAQQWMQLDQPLFAKVLPPAEKSTISSKQSQKKRENPYLRVINEMLLSYYNSTCVIVDERYHILYSYGDIDLYLRLIPGGELQHSILNMAREGLNVELTLALYEAFNSQETVTRENVWIKNKGREHSINLIVKPINDKNIGTNHRLIIFEPSSASKNILNVESAAGDEDPTSAELRTELQRSQQALQNAAQALQAKSEELSSSIREISLANKEIQTTNEELRTSKEELESLNEELNTLNSQLTNQNQELGYAHNALYNFLQSTAIGVIFLDLNLAIRDYTQAATKLFSLRKSDIGRPLSDIRSQFTSKNLIEDANRVLDTLDILEVEEATTKGDWYKVEVRPYRTMNNVIDGLVLTFNDITMQKQAQNKAEEQARYTRQVFDTIENSLLELDSNLRVVAANARFYQQFRVKKEETIGRLLYQLGNGQWDIPDLRRLLTEIIPQQTHVHDYTISHDFPELGRRTMRLNARKIDESKRILLVITELSS